MFHPTHALDSTVRMRAFDEDGADRGGPATSVARSKHFSIGGQVALIRDLNAATARNLRDADAGARAASVEIATAAEAAAETAATGPALHGSMADLGRALSDFRRGIESLVVAARAV